MTHPSAASLRVIAVPAFADNYLWIIHDGVHAAVVDPGDAAPILDALAAHHLTLTAILLTHRHADHIGGVPALLRHADVPVFGPRDEPIPTITEALIGGDVVDVPELPISLSVLDVPGHTSGHIAYFLEAQADAGRAPWLFCGDTLFGAGCGRLFDGTAAQLYDSLRQLATLPDDTLVYCAHEYTLSNLGFAAAVEPGNPAVRARMEGDSAKRAAGLATIPTTIGLEKATNPFLRVEQPAIAKHLIELGKLAPGSAPVDTFTALRLWKNTF